MPTGVTSVLENIWATDAEPIMINALAASGPIGAAIAAIFKIPVIGSILTYFLNNFVNGLIASGVIDIKVGLIGYMSAQAQAKWASELVILKQVSDAGKTLTLEQQAAYDVALQQLVQSHGGTANA